MWFLNQCFWQNRFLTDFDEVIAKHRFSSTQLKLTNDLNNPQRDATRDKVTERNIQPICIPKMKNPFSPFRVVAIWWKLLTASSKESVADTGRGGILILKTLELTMSPWWWSCLYRKLQPRLMRSRFGSFNCRMNLKSWYFVYLVDWQNFTFAHFGEIGNAQ